MSRRVSLPGAAELFRVTGGPVLGEPDEPTGSVATDGGTLEASTVAAVVVADRPEVATVVRSSVRRRRDERGPTGRERHDEKITVYCSPEELLDIEQARLTLRGDHGLVADRGRIVREAVAVVLADFDAKGEASILVRRLRGR